MNTVTLEQTIAALQAIGLQPGDRLLVHSAIQFLGRPVGGPAMYLEAIQTVIGSGCITVPTFNFAWARGETFDPQNTPSQGMGAFSELVRQHPNAHRTTHPMQSLAILGDCAAELAACDTPSAFDDGSAFDRLLKLDFKLLLLGAEIHAAAMVHYCEQRANVPYRYWKDFTGPVITPSGPEMRTYRMFVRDMQIDPLLRLHPIQALLQARQQWQEAPLNYGKLSACRLVDFVDAADHILTADPWALVANPPER